MSVRLVSPALRPAIVVAAFLVAASCSDLPTETPEASPPLLSSVEAWSAMANPSGPNPASNGQLFFSSPFVGFGVVQFPEACFLFEPGGDAEPDSWLRATLDDIVTMEHLVVQDGVLLVGSFFTGLEFGEGNGVLNAHFRRDGTFWGATISIVGKLEDRRSVNCKLNIGPDGEVVRSSISVK